MVLFDTGRLGVDSPDFSGANYPFVLPTSARDFLADVQVTAIISDDSPLHLLDVAALDTPSPRFTLGTSGGDVLISSDRAVSEITQWDADTRIILWRSDWFVVQMVVTLSKITAFTSAVLDDRAITYLPEPVLDIQVKDKAVGTYVSALQDHEVRFRGGYNVTMDPSTTTEDSGHVVSTVTIAASPGTGQGRHPACNVNAGITAIATARPDDSGNILITGKDCVVVKPVVQFTPAGAYVVPGEFKVLDDCLPPCIPKDFTDAATYVTRQWNRFVALAKRANELRDKYHGIIRSYADWYVCAAANPITGVVFKAQPCGLTVAVNVFNPHCVTLKGAAVLVKVVDSAGAELGAVAEYGIFTTKWENGTSFASATTATHFDGKYFIYLHDVPGGKISTTYIRLNLDPLACTPAGVATIELTGSYNLDFKDVKPIDVNFNLG